MKKMNDLNSELLNFYASPWMEEAKKARTLTSDLEYRHECLKLMYDDQVNCIPPHTVDMDIDEFIREEQAHS